MDFRIPAELTALRESFAAFLDREMRPVEDDVRGSSSDRHPTPTGCARPPTA